MKFNVVIPARYTSTRLPGKALLEIRGKPIIQYVYENACSSGAEQVIIATDDQRIVDCAYTFSAEVCLTSSQHKSGTDRITEVAAIYAWENDVAIVNVQGDEPMMPAENIKQVAENLISNNHIGMSTLCTPIIDEHEYKNTNVVKVIYDANNIAINFSRAIGSLIPYDNGNFMIYRHLGIYAYHVEFLKHFTALPQSPLEKKESLEQLRAVENGESIYVDVCRFAAGIGVDTQEDYQTILEMM